MAGRRQAPKAKPRPRKRASKKRQPKRILNVVPSPKTQEDWTFRNAQEADMIATAPRVPSTKDLRQKRWDSVPELLLGGRTAAERSHIVGKSLEPA